MPLVAVSGTNVVEGSPSAPSVVAIVVVAAVVAVSVAVAVVVDVVVGSAVASAGVGAVVGGGFDGFDVMAASTGAVGAAESLIFF
jgi:hypothetical protein